MLITLDMAALYPQMAGMLGKTRLNKLVVGSLAQMTSAPAKVAAQMKAQQQTVEVARDDRHVGFASLLDNDGAFTRHPVADPKDAIAALQYTGGTTGLPKGAMLTHANLWAACAQTFETTCGGTPQVLQEGQDRAVLPPSHIYALTVDVLFCVRLGAEVIRHLRFDPKAALHDISGQQATLFCGVPTMFTALINDPETPKHSLRSLEYCNSGGAPLPVEVANRFIEVTGCPVVEGWGMTETSPTGTFTPVHGKRKAGSCGIPHPGVTIKLLDLDDPGRYVAPGERGEMCIQGPNVMKGYWNKPDATAESTTFDGFFRTGDVATMDEDGFVFIVDRCKDMERKRAAQG